jgi:hypothetical protein
MVFVLFSPFNFMKWLCIALAAFLYSCGEQGGGSIPSYNPFPSLPTPAQPAATRSPFAPSPPHTPFAGANQAGSQAITAMVQAFHAHMFLAFTLIGLVLVLMLAITVIMTWLKARGSFILMDQLVRNSDQIVNPWNELGELANSYTWCALAVTAIFMMTGTILAGITAAIAWPSIAAQTFGTSAVVAIVFGLLAFPIFFILGMIISIILQDIVAPAMYARRMTALQVWPDVRAQIIGPHFTTILLFCLLYWGIVFCSAFVISLAGCCTCCCAYLPYVGTVILLPVFVFRRLFGVYFVDQFGGHWSIFSPEDRTCPRCSYSLRGLGNPQRCPECGAVLDFQSSPPPSNPPPPPPSAFPPIE